MSSGDDPQSAILTADDVRRWKEERARLEARLAQVIRKIEAAELLFPGIGSSAPVRAVVKKQTNVGGSMGDAVKMAIREAGTPLAPPDMRQRLEGSGFAEQLSKNPNYLYTVIFRLTKRGELVRTGDRYQLSPEGNSSDEEAGEGDPLPQLLNFSR